MQTFKRSFCAVVQWRMYLWILNICDNIENIKLPFHLIAIFNVKRNANSNRQIY